MPAQRLLDAVRDNPQSGLIELNLEYNSVEPGLEVPGPREHEVPLEIREAIDTLLAEREVQREAAAEAAAAAAEAEAALNPPPPPPVQVAVEAGGEQDSGPEPMHPHDGRRVYMPEPEDEGFVEGIVPDRKPYNAEEERMIALASQEEMVEYYYRMDGTRLKHPQKPKKWEEVGYRRYEDL